MTTEQEAAVHRAADEQLRGARIVSSAEARRYARRIAEAVCAALRDEP